MTNFTNYTESLALDHLVGDTTWNKPNGGSGCWFAAFEVMPDDAGAGATEATYTDYARINIAQADATWTKTTITDGQRFENAAVIAWPTPGATDGNPVVGFGAFNAETGGDLLFYGDFDSSKTPTIGVPDIGFEINGLKIEMTNATLCDPFVLALLNHMLATDTWAKPATDAITIDLCTTMPNQAGGGAVLYTGNGYGQPILGPETAKWTLPSGGNGLATLKQSAVFGTPSADWVGIDGYIISSGGTVYFSLAFGDAPRTYTAGEVAYAPAGSLTLSIQ